MTRHTSRRLLALALAAGSAAAAQAEGWLRRLQPSELPPLPSATTPTTRTPPPPTPPPAPTVQVIEPAPQPIFNSPYAHGERRLVEPRGEVNDVATHPSGRWIAAASGDRKVHLWDLRKNTHTTYEIPGGDGQHVRFSPDGRWLAALGIDTSGGVMLIPFGLGGPGKPVSVSKGGGFNNQVAFSPDSRRMAVDGYQKVLVYDVPASGRPTAEPSIELPSETSGICRISFSPDGHYLVASDLNGTIQSWDARTWQRQGTWKVPKAKYSVGQVHGVLPTALGRQAWILTTDQLIGLDYTTGTWGPAYHHLGGYFLAQRPGGRTLARGLLSGACEVVDPTNGDRILRLEGHREFVKAGAYLPDGRLVTGADGGTVVIWKMIPEAELTGRKAGGPLHRAQYPFRTTVPRRGQEAPGLSIADLPEKPISNSSADGVGATFSPDGRYLASGYSGELRIHRPGAEEALLEIDRLSGEGRVTSWFPDSARVATIDKEYVRVYAVPSGEAREAWTWQSRWGNNLVVFPDGKLLAHGSYQDVSIVSTATGVVQTKYEVMGKVETVSSPRVRAFDVSPDGARLVTGGDDGVLRLWEARSGRALAEFAGAHGASVQAARFLPDNTVVSLGQDGAVHWWGGALEPRRREEGHVGEGRSLAVDPTHRLVASGARDGAVILWGFDGTKKLRLETDLDEVTDLAVSPDGAWLVVGGDSDGSLRLRLPQLLARLAP